VLAGEQKISIGASRLSRSLLPMLMTELVMGLRRSPVALLELRRFKSVMNE